MDKIKIILDTDIGDDIDDSFALMIALTSPKIELLGVTTVFRNAEQRARMAAHLINKMGKKIPVYAGEDMPLCGNYPLIDPEIKAREKYGEDGKYILPQWLPEMSSTHIESQHAVDYIIETIHRYPHEVVLVPIGPMTNIALAIKKDPTIIPLIKEIRAMNGGYNISFVEWNVYCDIEASNVIYNTPITLCSIGINVTMNASLNKEDINELQASDSLPIQIVYEMMMKWFAHYKFERPVMHDPLAVLTLLDDEVVEFKSLPMQVDMGGRKGFMDEDPNKTILTNMSMSVNVERFRKLFKTIIFEKN